MGANRLIKLFNQGELRLYELLANGQNNIAIKAPATLAADYSLTMPAAQGGVNTFLKNDGAGVLTWGASAASLQAAYDGGRVIDATPGPVDLKGSIRIKGPEPHYSITHPDFGAVGDDATDNLTAIQAAIDAADAAGGGVVFFPPGIFRFSGQLDHEPNVTLRGAGRGISILKYTGAAVALSVDDGGAGDVKYECGIEDIHITDAGTGTDGLKFVGVNMFVVRGCRVNGFTSGVHFAGTAAKPVVNIGIENCEIDTNTNGIVADTTNNANNAIRLEGVRIRSNSTRGIESNVDVRAWHIVNCDIAGNTSGGIRFAELNGSTLHGNYFEETAAAISVELLDGAGVSIKGNIFQGFTSAHDCIKLGTTNPVLGADISGNFFSLGHASSVAINAFKLNDSRIGPNQEPTTGTYISYGTVANVVAFDAGKMEMGNELQVNVGKSSGCKSLLGRTYKIVTKETTHTFTSGATNTISPWFPAGTLLMGCAFKITESVSGPTDISIGDGITGDLIVQLWSPLTAGQNRNGWGSDTGTGTWPLKFIGAKNLVFTAVGGNFDGVTGIMECTSWWAEADSNAT